MMKLDDEQLLICKENGWIEIYDINNLNEHQKYNFKDLGNIHEAKNTKREDELCLISQKGIYFISISYKNHSEDFYFKLY
jgi:hypothetical protein